MKLVDTGEKLDVDAELVALENEVRRSSVGGLKYFSAPEEEMLAEVGEEKIMPLSIVRRGSGELERGYVKSLDSSVKEMKFLHTELERLIRKEEGGLPGSYERTRAFILNRIFNRQEVSEDEIFLRQLGNTEDLAGALKNIVGYSKKIASMIGDSADSRLFEERMINVDEQRKKRNLEQEVFLYQSVPRADDIAVVIDQRRRYRNIMDGERELLLYSDALKYLAWEIPLLDEQVQGLAEATAMCERTYHSARYLRRTLELMFAEYSAIREQDSVMQLMPEHWEDVDRSFARTVGGVSKSLGLISASARTPLFGQIQGRAEGGLKDFCDEVINLRQDQYALAPSYSRR